MKTIFGILLVLTFFSSCNPNKDLKSSRNQTPSTENPQSPVVLDSQSSLFNFAGTWEGLGTSVRQNVIYNCTDIRVSIVATSQSEFILNTTATCNPQGGVALFDFHLENRDGILYDSKEKIAGTLQNTRFLYDQAGTRLQMDTDGKTIVFNLQFGSDHYVQGTLTKHF